MKDSQDGAGSAHFLQSREAAKGHTSYHTDTAGKRDPRRYERESSHLGTFELTEH